MARFAVRVVAKGGERLTTIFSQRQRAVSHAAAQMREGAELAEIFECDTDVGQDALSMLEHDECRLIGRRPVSIPLVLKIELSDKIDQLTRILTPSHKEGRKT